MRKTINKTSLARRLAAVSLFSFALLPLAAGATTTVVSTAPAPTPAKSTTPGTPAAPAVILPTGSTLGSGTATVTTSGSTLTINQTSAKAILNWSAFSIGAGGTVQFNNGTGATLNRVTGATLSQIDGTLSGTGSVYLINPNGVVIGKSGVINVGGRFVASAQALADSAFLAGGDLTFSGASTATVINYGKVGSSGGDVVLIASKVENDGSITAANGAVGLLAGTKILLRDQALDSGRFAVQAGGASTSATNSGAVTAAEVELRANGGNVYALAGNATGVIAATGVGALDGKVYLVADGGTASIAGKITARAKGGVGSTIETSGQSVQIGQASVDAGKGGNWLIDPTNLTIDQTAANTIVTSLKSNQVTEKTTATGSGGSGDIVIAPNVSLVSTSGFALTLSAYHNISIGSGDYIEAGTLILRADNTATGSGTVTLGSNVSLYAGDVFFYYNPLSYADPGTMSTATSSPFHFATGLHTIIHSDMLVNNVNQLQAISTNLNGSYALGANIDASATASWNGGRGFVPIGYVAQNSANAFTGVLTGLSDNYYVIKNLTVNQGVHDSATGLFAVLSGTVQNLSISNASITGGGSVGILAGSAVGANVQSVSVSGTVTGLTSGGAGGYSIGGLIGYARNSQITSSSSAGTVSGLTYVGGLVGDLNGSTTVSSSTSSATVKGGLSGSVDIGGLIGNVENGARVTNSGAQGTVSGASAVGGLAGEVGGLVDSSTANGTVSGGAVVGGLAGSVDLGATISSSGAYGKVTGAAAVGGLVGESSGTLTLDYATGSVIATNSGSGNGLGVLGAGGLVGELDHGSVVQSYASGDVGAQGSSYLGGLVGFDAAASISQSYATGSVSGSGVLGGLVGYNANGAISDVYASGPVHGTGLNVGGLIGQNGGSVTNGYALGMVVDASGGVGGAIGSGSGTNVFWNTDTSGITTNAPGTGGTGLSSNTLFTALPAGFSPSVWSIIPGSSMPYLKWQFGGATPITFTGNVQDASGNGLAGRNVDMLVNGAVAANTYSFANGYFYFLLAPTATNGGNVTLFLKNAPEKATTVLEDFGGSESGVQLKAGSLILAGAYDVTSLSQLFASAKQSVGAYSDPGLLFTQAGVASGTPVTLFSLGSTFSIDAVIDTGAAALTIEEQGAVTEGAAGSINTGQLILNGGSSGVFNLHGGQNHIAAVSGQANSIVLSDVLDATKTGLTIDSAGGLSGLTTTGQLTIDTQRILYQGPGAPLNVGSLRLTAGAMSLGDINAGSGDITLTSTVSGIGVGGVMATTGHLVVNTAGGIGESNNGSITAYSLQGSSGGSVLLTSANNIHSLWSFNYTGTSTTTAYLFNLVDSSDIHMTGTVSGFYQTSLASQGNIYVQANITTASPDIKVFGNTLVTLNAGGTIQQQTQYAIMTGTLTGYATGGVNLMGQNVIGNLSAFTNQGGGDFFFNDTRSMNISGPVSAGTGVLELISSGSMNIGGMLSAGQSSNKFIYLGANGAVTETGSGGVNAYALQGNSVGGANLGGSNNLHSFWGWVNSGAGGFSLNAIGGDLHITGAIYAGTGALSLTTQSGELLLQANLTAGTSVGLTANTSDIRQASGIITAGVLNATAATSITLPSHNVIGALGTIHSGSGQVAIN